MGSASDGAVIDEFTRRKVVFREKWNRLIVLEWLPLFVVFGASAYFGIDKSFPIVVVPLLVGGITVVGVRAFKLVRTHHTCPVCDQWQRFGYFLPFRRCRGCGARLSMGPST